MRLNSEIIARANRMKLIMQFGVGIEGSSPSSSVLFVPYMLLLAALNSFSCL